VPQSISYLKWLERAGPFPSPSPVISWLEDSIVGASNLFPNVLFNFPMAKFPEVQGGGSLILAWQVRNKHVLVIGGGEVCSIPALSAYLTSPVMYTNSPHRSPPDVSSMFLMQTPESQSSAQPPASTQKLPTESPRARSPTSTATFSLPTSMM